MKTSKHINEGQRKVICSGLPHNKKLYQIADMIKLDPRSVSKEIKRNRTPIDFTDGAKSNCSKLNRWPYVCSYCKNRYNKNCIFVKFKYDSKIVQRKADANLVNSRKGIDLPYAVKYKKRKHNKKYDYSSNNKIDRTGHTYLDYLSYIHKNPGINVWQFDFLGAIKTDSKNIISFMLPFVHFTLLQLINKPNCSNVVKFFDDLEERIGTEAFMDLIPVILTDRDSNFTDIEGICFTKITGEERCKLFFCDPYVSSQKPNVENINKQIRKFFPKGKSIDIYSQKDIKQKNLILLKSPLKSLDGYTPKDAFKSICGKDLCFKIYGKK